MLLSSRKLSEFTKNAPKQTLEYFDLYHLKFGEVAVNLYVSRKRASKATHIHCTESGDIIWEQFYLFGGMSRPARERYNSLKPEQSKNAISIVIIRGNAGNIIGLDDTLIKSHLAEPKPSEVYLMSEKNAVRFLQSI